MYRDHLKRIFIMLTLGLALTSLFVLPKLAKAALVLPTTNCDTTQDNLVLNGFSIHLTSGMTREDGGRVFGYGEANNFVSLSDNEVIFNFLPLFDIDSPDEVVKLMGFDASCNIIFGLGPTFRNSNPGVINQLVYNLSTSQASMNGLTRTNFPTGNIRYLWIEMWDGNVPSNFASYSYLVDIQNIKNPTGTIDTPPTEPAGKRPVLIIPGIMGSELYEGDDFIWPSTKALASSPTDSFLSEILALDEEGNSIKNIRVEDIIKKVDVGVSQVNTFDSLINEFMAEHYNIDQNLFVFPYDWRLDLDEIDNLLNNKIKEIQERAGSERINIVAHSMGGLLFANYVNEYGTASVDKLLFVGTPHLGAPKAVNALLEGNIDIPMSTVNGDAIKKVAVNSPSIYQLLPNPKYFESFQGYLKPLPSREGVLSYSQTKNFLSKVGKNTTLINNAEEFFDQRLEDLDFQNIEVFNISGCKTGTQAFYNVDLSNGHILNIKYTKGDGTVPFVSSDYSTGSKYYVKNGKHSELPSTEGVKQLILSILDNREVLANNTSRSSDFCALSGKKLTWRSPVEIHIYDSANNHAGPITEGFENNILGVSYDIIDGEKFIFLPTDEGQEYRIEGIGLDTGSFDLLITAQENDIEGKSKLFDNIKIVPNSFVSFTVSEDSDDSKITFNFDESTEATTLISTEFASEEEAFAEAMSDPIPEPEPTPEPSPGPQPGSYGGGGGSGGLLPVPEETQAKETGNILGEAIERIPDGTLVLDTTDGITVYMIQNQGKKYGFISEQIFLNRGYKFQDVIIADLSKHQLGGLIIDVLTTI